MNPRLRFTVNLGPPPSHADKQESPVVKEFRRLTFKCMADELEDPSQQEKRESVGPQAMHENAGHEDAHREKNQRDAQSVAGAVHGMLMAGGVLRDPLFAGAVS